MSCYHWILAGILILPHAGAAAETVSSLPPLPIDEAEALAVAGDDQASAFEANAQARREQSVSASQLPDPKLKLGAMNLPTDSFSRSQAPMTQMQIGVQQRIPPGRSLALAGERQDRLARGMEARAEVRRLQVLKELRKTYLELYYQSRAVRILDASRTLFNDLLDITRSYYASGRKNQQDVLRAEVELSLLDDRRDRVQTRLEKARAELVRLVGGAAARRPLPEDFPELPDVPPLERIRETLSEHPRLQVAHQQVAAGRLNVDAARERYKPGWMLDLTYGDRTGTEPDGSRRSDFLSAMVVLDLPLFTDKRQDRELASRQYELNAVQYQRDDLLRELTGELESANAEWLRLQQRLARYRDQVLPEARQHADSSRKAYQSGVSDFTGLMRARLIELDARLTTMRLRTDLAQTQARLLYLAGETQ